MKISCWTFLDPWFSQISVTDIHNLSYLTAVPHQSVWIGISQWPPERIPGMFSPPNPSPGLQPAAVLEAVTDLGRIPYFNGHFAVLQVT